MWNEPPEWEGEGKGGQEGGGRRGERGMVRPSEESGGPATKLENTERI